MLHSLEQGCQAQLPKGAKYQNFVQVNGQFCQYKVKKIDIKIFLKEIQKTFSK